MNRYVSIGGSRTVFIAISIFLRSNFVCRHGIHDTVFNRTLVVRTTRLKLVVFFFFFLLRESSELVIVRNRYNCDDLILIKLNFMIMNRVQITANILKRKSQYLLFDTRKFKTVIYILFFVQCIHFAEKPL